MTKVLVRAPTAANCAPLRMKTPQQLREKLLMNKSVQPTHEDRDEGDSTSSSSASSSSSMESMVTIASQAAQEDQIDAIPRKESSLSIDHDAAPDEQSSNNVPATQVSPEAESATQVSSEAPATQVSPEVAQVEAPGQAQAEVPNRKRKGVVERVVETIRADDTPAIIQSKMKTIRRSTDDEDYSGFLNDENVTGRRAYTAFTFMSSQLADQRRKHSELEAKMKGRVARDDVNDALNGRFDECNFNDIPPNIQDELSDVRLFDVSINMFRAAQQFNNGGADEKDTVYDFARQVLFEQVPQYQRHCFTWVTGSAKKCNTTINIPANVQAAFHKTVCIAFGVSPTDPATKELRDIIRHSYTDHMGHLFKRFRGDYNLAHPEQEVKINRTTYSPSMVSACALRLSLGLPYPSALAEHLAE